jgi:hypothetical protein
MRIWRLFFADKGKTSIDILAYWIWDVSSLLNISYGLKHNQQFQKDYPVAEEKTAMERYIKLF